jgi:hypothetical protein
MLGLNFLVKRAHKSIPGLWLQENDHTMTGGAARVLWDYSVTFILQYCFYNA